MRRHAWNCDLSTKPGTDILTNRHIYIYISLSLSRAHLHDLRLLDLNLLAHLFPDNVPHLTIPKPDGILHLNVADPFAETEPDTKTKIIPSTITFPGPGGTKISWGDPLKTLTRKALHPSELQILKSPLAGSLTITRMPTRSRSTPASARAQTLVGFCQAVSFRLWAQWGLDIHEDRLEIRYQDLDGDTFPGEPL